VALQTSKIVMMGVPPILSETASFGLATALGVQKAMVDQVVRAAPIVLFDGLTQVQAQEIVRALGAMVPAGVNFRVSILPEESIPRINWPMQPKIHGKALAEYDIAPASPGGGVSLTCPHCGKPISLGLMGSGLAGPQEAAVAPIPMAQPAGAPAPWWGAMPGMPPANVTPAIPVPPPNVPVVAPQAVNPPTGVISMQSSPDHSGPIALEDFERALQKTAPAKPRIEDDLLADLDGQLGGFGNGFGFDELEELPQAKPGAGRTDIANPRSPDSEILKTPLPMPVPPPPRKAPPAAVQRVAPSAPAKAAPSAPAPVAGKGAPASAPKGVAPKSVSPAVPKRAPTAPTVSAAPAAPAAPKSARSAAVSKAAGESGDYSIFVSKGKNPKLPELLAQICGISMDEAQKLATKIIIPVKKQVSKEEAESVKQKFIAAGISARITKITKGK